MIWPTPEKHFRHEITSFDPEISNRFIGGFQHEVEEFADKMAAARMAWFPLLGRAQPSHPLTYLVNMVHCAMTLHIQSMKLFLSGHLVAAGNLSRQSVEAIAMSILCSDQTLTFLSRFMEGRYMPLRQSGMLERIAKYLDFRSQVLRRCRRHRNSITRSAISRS